jgi:Na+-translocating ferredoxin:NAD+ oxidoreductase RnfG subunit
MTMKKIMMVLLCAGLIALPAQLQAEKDADAPKKPKKEIPAEVLKKYDTDGDGKLSKEEKKQWKADQKAVKKAKKDSGE